MQASAYVPMYMEKFNGDALAVTKFEGQVVSNIDLVMKNFVPRAPTYDDFVQTLVDADAAGYSSSDSANKVSFTCIVFTSRQLPCLQIQDAFDTWKQSFGDRMTPELSTSIGSTLQAKLQNKSIYKDVAVKGGLQAADPVVVPKPGAFMSEPSCVH
jgi:hypothetical protein